MGALTRLLTFAFKREREEKKWQEWLAFTPIAALSGGRVTTFEEFLAIKPKKKAPMSVIEEIRKKFKL